MRVDTHLYPGYEVPPYYDSLLAKLIVWGETREIALARSRRALAEFQVAGVKTNLPFHRGIIDNAGVPGGRGEHQPARSGRPRRLRGGQCLSNGARSTDQTMTDDATTARAVADLTLPLEAADIMRIIPHRYPVLLIDRVIELEPGKHVVAIKNLTNNEPQFTGHFPGRPIMPGVLMVEALAQAGAVAVLSLPSTAASWPSSPGSTSAASSAPCVPGDTLRLEVTLEKLRGVFGRGLGVATVDGEVAVQATISFVIPRDQSIGERDLATEHWQRPSSADRGERRVVITGMGAVTPIGKDVPASGSRSSRGAAASIGSPSSTPPGSTRRSVARCGTSSRSW